jgi:hypothetical protein
MNRARAESGLEEGVLSPREALEKQTTQPLLLWRKSPERNSPGLWPQGRSLSALILGFSHRAGVCLMLVLCLELLITASWCLEKLG